MARHGTHNRTTKDEMRKRTGEPEADAITKEGPEELTTEQLDKVTGGRKHIAQPKYE